MAIVLRRLAILSVMALLLSRPPAQRLSELLRPGFLASLTATAASAVAAVHAIYVPLMHEPIAIYLREAETVLYGPHARPDGVQHEAMHVVDPCRAEAACERAFADGVPPELLYSAWELYGKGAWNDGEVWAMVPMLFDWEPDAMPIEVRAAYAGVFRVDALTAD